MSTYCISDVHGHKQELELMLDKIAFSESDDLYLLGDIADKGPESAELLIWAVEDAPSNVHFLKGNHEDLMYSALAPDPAAEFISVMDPWGYNGGAYTHQELMKLADEKWVEYILLPWIENLPLYKRVLVKGKEFMLVHGGFNPYVFENIPPERQRIDWHCDANVSPYADERDIRVGHGFGIQNAQNMLWERDTWIESPDNAPCDTIFGHTYITKERVKALKKAKIVKNARGGSGRIAHIQNKHGIDCGCAKASHASDFDDGKYNLACLRLEDMKEFYVPCRLGI